MSDEVIDEIEKALIAIVAPGEVVEIRALGDRQMIGYFDDLHAAAVEAEKLDRAARHAGIYITANPIDPALLARAENRIRPANGKGEATSDCNVVRRRWLLLDLDPVRPKGVGATDEQKAAAIARAVDVHAFLGGLGWTNPLEGDSGNGAHLLYPICLPNDSEADKLVSAVLAELARRYSDEKVAVDVAVKNAARIWKLYGTMARKGDSTAARPHRRSHLLSVPDSEAIVDKAQLEALAAMVPAKPAPARTTRTAPAHSARPAFDIAAWIAAHGIEVSSEGPWQDGYLWELAVCPWNSDHLKTAYITRGANGAIGAKCHHQSCQAHDWKELREMLEPEARERRERWEAGGQRQAGPPPRGDDEAPPSGRWEQAESPTTEASGFACSSERLDGEEEARAALVARRLSLGMSFLDDALAGLLPHDLLLLGAYAGMGKTTIAAVATASALAAGKRVHFLALEAEPREIERRLLFDALASRWFGMDAGERVRAPEINYRSWYLGQLKEAFAPFDAEVRAEVRNRMTRLHTCYRGSNFTVDDLDREIRSTEGQTDLIILDHLHYVDVRDNESENAGVKAIVKRVRDLALAQAVPAIVVAHLRKRDRGYKQLVPELDDFHGTSDAPKIVTKCVVIASAPACEQGQEARWIWPTYVAARKERMLGAVTRYLARCRFDARTNGYLDDYTLGREVGEKFVPVLPSEVPTWAERARQPRLPSTPEEERYP